MNIIFNKVVLIIAGLAIAGAVLYSNSLKPKSIPPIPIENRAHFSAGTTLSFSPATLNLTFGQTQKIEIRANFAQGSNEEKLIYFKTEVLFPNQYLELVNIDIIPSGLNFLKGQPDLNQTNSAGKLLIQIAPNADTDVRPATNSEMTIAILTFKAIQKSDSSQTLTFNPQTTEVVNNLRPDPKNIAVTRFEQADIIVQ